MRSSKAFTLVEMIISITLMGFVLFLVYESIGNVSLSNHILKKVQTEKIYEKRRVELLQEDILSARTVKIENKHKDFHILHLQTNNSIHGIIEPYVKWLVSTKDDTLMRLESSKSFNLPLDYDSSTLPYLDVMQSKLKRFKVYIAKEKKFILIELQDEKKHDFFELFKPLEQDL